MDLEQEDTTIADTSILDVSIIQEEEEVGDGANNNENKLRRSRRVKKVIKSYAIFEEEIRDKLGEDVKMISSSKALETIFEEPKKVREQIQYTSLRKYKRVKHINDGSYRPLNTIKRRKLIKAGVIKRKKVKENISIETVLNKLAEIKE